MVSPSYFMRTVSWWFQLAFYCHILCSIFIKMYQKCVNNPNDLCYIYGEVAFDSKKCLITPAIKKVYFLYFGCKVGDQDTKWAPHVCCTTCSCKFNAWVNGKGRCMPFGGPIVWRMPCNYRTDCYFCIVPPIQNGMSMKKKSKLVYPNIPSAIRPVPHGDGLLVPESPGDFATYYEDKRVLLQTAKNSSHQLQEMQTTSQAQTLPIIRSQKTSSMALSWISNFHKIRQNFWHQGYSSGIYYIRKVNGAVQC